MKKFAFALATISVFAYSVPAFAAGDAAVGKTKYSMLCQSCHGATGKGDGPAAAALNPKPRNFGDKEWQKKTDDAKLTKVIKDGGTAVGLSPLMPAWKGALNDADVTNVIAFIRSLGK